MKLDDAILLLQGLSAREIREFVRARLPPPEAEGFDVLIRNVSRDVLVLVSARVLTRLAANPPSGPRSAAHGRVTLRAPMTNGRG
jgi:hypothetical protein